MFVACYILLFTYESHIDGTAFCALLQVRNHGRPFWGKSIWHRCTGKLEREKKTNIYKYIEGMKKKEEVKCQVYVDHFSIYMSFVHQLQVATLKVVPPSW